MSHFFNRRFHKKGYINNFFVVGAPSIANGSLVSGFSTSNYLTMPEVFDVSDGSTWEMVYKFTTGSDVISASNITGGNGNAYRHVFIYIDSSSLHCCIGSNGSSWNIAEMKGGDILPNSTYFVKAEFTGSAYNFYYSTTNDNYTLISSVESTTPIYKNELTQSIGLNKYSNGSNGPFLGSIDLKECYIKINGGYFWQPYKRCKYDYNFTRVGTPSISNPPSCEVSGFSTSNYITKALTFDINGDWEIVTRVNFNGTNHNGTLFSITKGNTFGINFYTTATGVKLAFNHTPNSGWSYVDIEATIPSDRWLFIKYVKTGTTFTFYFSEDGEVFEEKGSHTFTSTLYEADGFAIGCGYSQTALPSATIVDLTQTNIKVNGEPIWTCFKQSDHLSFDEKGTVEDYDFFEYKQYGLKYRNYRKGYINNFFTVGSPTFDGSVVSGFSSANYLRLPFQKAFNPESNPWEVVLKINLTKEVSTQGVFGYRGSGYFRLDIYQNKLRMNLSTSSSSWTIAQLVGNTEIPLNVDCWIKYEFTGEAYNLYYSSDGITYHLDGTLSSTSIPTFPSSTSIGAVHTGSDTSFLNGTLDLSESYININGKRWWDGLKRCKYDYNFTTVGTPSISNPPSCEVSGFSASNYIMLPEVFISDEITEGMVAFTTANDITTAQGLFLTTISDDSSSFGISDGVLKLINKIYGSSTSSVSLDLSLTPNTKYYFKFIQNGTSITPYISTDGVDFVQGTTVTRSKEFGNWFGYGLGNDTKVPFLGSIDLTQSYIKINGELWWSCFKQNNHVAFDEKATKEDYDFITTHPHFIEHDTKNYYKIVPWEQPILTSNTSYGAVTGSSYSGSRYYYCISDGKIPTTNDASDNWGTNNTAIGWVNWALEEEIIIKGIKIYNRSHTTTVDYTLTGARFYTNSMKTTPIGEEFEILTSQGIYELTTIPEEGIKTNNIYFYKTGSTYSGIGELEITADKVVQSTYKDWDFYETIREVRKFYKNISDFTHTATSGWSNVSNAFDGSEDTYASCGTTTDYIEIDFGKEVFVDGFVATGNQVASVARAEDLRLYTVDDSDVETLIAQSTGAVGTTTYTTSASFNRIKTSKIRFRLSETNYAGNPPTTQYPTRIREINIKPYCESDSSDYDFHKLEEEKNIVYNNKSLKINPTPSYATVTINGEERNEIELMRNSSVSWSVSLDGYKTQSGTLRLSEDTVIDVVLEERGEPLWACYRDGNYYFYVQTPLSINSIWGEGPNGQVSNSSEINTGQMSKGELISVDEEMLVVSIIYTQQCYRYYEGDLYE